MWLVRNFDRHFQEWRHAHGMRCLGIPNTKHFHDIILIQVRNSTHTDRGIGVTDPLNINLASSYVALSAQACTSETSANREMYGHSAVGLNKQDLNPVFLLTTYVVKI